MANITYASSCFFHRNLLLQVNCKSLEISDHHLQITDLLSLFVDIKLAKTEQTLT